MQQDLDAAGGDGLADLLAELRAIEHVRVGVVRLAEERAEAAGGGADVGVVDVAVDDVRDLGRRVERAAAAVGGGAERDQLGALERGGERGGRQARAGRGRFHRDLDVDRRGALAEEPQPRGREQPRARGVAQEHVGTGA